MSIDVFFKELKEEEVFYFCWKGIGKIDDFYEGKSDVDLYIPPSEAILFKKILKRNGFVAFYWPLGVTGVEHFYKIGPKGESYHLHAYFKLRTGSSLSKEFELKLINLDNNSIFEYKNIKTLNRDWMNAIHYKRLYLKKSSILGRAFLKYKKPVYDVEEGLLGSVKVHKLIKVKKIVNHPFWLDLKLLILIKYRRLCKLSKRPSSGVVVSIVGPDGSGKSTISQVIQNKYSQNFSITQLSFGKPSPRLNTFLFWLLRSVAITIKHTFKKNKDSSGKKNSDKKHSLLEAIFYIFLAIERRSIINKSHKLASKGVMVILDRCPPKKNAGFDGYHLSNSKSDFFLFHMLKKIETEIYDSINPVDIAFVLNPTLHQVIERNRNRKKKFKETDIEIKERFKIFSNFQPKSIYLLDLSSELSPSDNASLVMKKIFEKII
jgi:hypothetical protein